MIKKLYKKYEEVILYVVFGGLTTLVNFVSFWVFNKILGEKFYLVSNVIAWFISVVFAYVTNKLWVFESKSWAFKILLKEVPEFFAARLFSLGVEEGGLWLFVDIFKFDRYSFTVFNFEVTGKLIAKVLLAVIVVILNYFFSKFIIFATKGKKKDKKEIEKEYKQNGSDFRTGLFLYVGANIVRLPFLYMIFIHFRSNYSVIDMQFANSCVSPVT